MIMVIFKWLINGNKEFSEVKKEIRLFESYIADFYLIEQNLSQWVGLWNHGRLKRLKRSIERVRNHISDEEHIVENEERIRGSISTMTSNPEEQAELFRLHQILHELSQNLERQIRIYKESQVNWEVFRRRVELQGLIDEQRRLIFGSGGEEELLGKLKGKTSRRKAARAVTNSLKSKIRSVQNGLYDVLYPRVKDGMLTPYALERPEALQVEDSISHKMIEGAFVVDQELRPHIRSKVSWEETFQNVHESKITAAVNNYIEENAIRTKQGCIGALAVSYGQYDILAERKNVLLLSAVRERFQISRSEKRVRASVKKLVCTFIFEVPDPRKKLRIGLSPKEYEAYKETVDYLLDEYDLYLEFLDAHRKVWNSFLKWYAENKIKNTQITNIATNMAAFTTSSVVAKKMIGGKELSNEDILMGVLIGLVYALQSPYLYRVIHSAIPVEKFKSRTTKVLGGFGRAIADRVGQLPLQWQHYSLLWLKNSELDLKRFVSGWFEGGIKKGTISWGAYMPFGFAAGFVIHNKVPLKFRYLAAACWNVVFGIAAEIYSNPEIVDRLTNLAGK